MASRAIFNSMGVHGSSAPVNRMVWRLFSDDRGRVLHEEEKAAENIYIKVTSHLSNFRLKITEINCETERENSIFSLL